MEVHTPECSKCGEAGLLVFILTEVIDADSPIEDMVCLECYAKAKEKGKNE